MQNDYRILSHTDVGGRIWYRTANQENKVHIPKCNHHPLVSGLTAETDFLSLFILSCRSEQKRARTLLGTGCRLALNLNGNRLRSVSTVLTQLRCTIVYWKPRVTNFHGSKVHHLAYTCQIVLGRVWPRTTACKNKQQLEKHKGRNHNMLEIDKRGKKK